MPGSAGTKAIAAQERGIRRHWLDWTSPPLPLAAGWLMDRFRQADRLEMSNVLLVLPTAYGCRRLAELLFDAAEGAQLAFAPPDFCTAGRLPEHLYSSSDPFADDTAQRMAWVEVLKSADPDDLSVISTHFPGSCDLAGWIELAGILQSWHRELAGESLSFRDVRDHGRSMSHFPDLVRWEVLWGLQQDYFELLTRCGLWDRQTARRVAVDRAECATDRDIVLVGTVDLNKTLRQMLDQVSERVDSLVFCDPGLAEHFDAIGCLKTARWQSLPVQLPDGLVEVADGPADQAAMAVEFVAGLAPQFSADQVGITATDGRLEDHLRRAFSAAGAEARVMAGSLVQHSLPARLLREVARWIASGRFSAFSRLVRQPAMSQWLDRKLKRGDWLIQLDRYQNQRLPYRLEVAPLEDQSELSAIVDPVARLTQPLSGPTRPLQQWAGPWLQLLASVYGWRKLDRQSPQEMVLFRSLAEIRDALAALHRLPAELSQRASAADALSVALHRLAGRRILPPAAEQSISVLGWLDTPWDDSQVTVVTGFNEGVVPRSESASLFLPNTMRSRLGLDDNARRYARDAYALCLLVRSRRRLLLIAGRRDQQGDPLFPSRLLLSGQPADVAQRCLRWFGKGRQVQPLALVDDSGLRATQGFVIPAPALTIDPRGPISVTAFRDYLRCPYRFYLTHVLKLRQVEDSPEQMDPANFGTIMHNVLAEFGQSDLANSSSAAEIGQLLICCLHEQSERLFGPCALPAVRLQLQQMALRLEAFARVQARRAAAGWKIVAAELAPLRAVLQVDGEPFEITGRIDRIDRHQHGGQLAIWDYKTSEQPRDPKRAHFTNGRWVDLQLPLYRRLVEGTDWTINQPCILGYVSLCNQPFEVGFRAADWGAPDLQQAEQVAHDVIRRIRNAEFWPLAPPPPFADGFEWICQDQVFEPWRNNS